MKEYFYIIIYMLGLITILYMKSILIKLEKIEIKIKRKAILLYLINYTVVSFYLYIKKCNYSNYLITIFTLIILLIVSIIDKRTLIIPDKYPLLIVFLGIVNIVSKNISIKNSILGLIFTLGFLLFIVILECILKIEDLLGGGDIKLYISLGILMGIKSIILIIFLSNLIALIANMQKQERKKQIISFAPYIYISYSILKIIDIIPV